MIQLNVFIDCSKRIWLNLIVVYIPYNSSMVKELFYVKQSL